MIGASERGLQIIDAARKKKRWTKTSSFIWWRTAKTSRATLRRFWRGIAINRETFIDICAAVGIADWQKIADVSGEDIAKTVAISYSDQPSSQNLARQFYQAFQGGGYHPLLIGDDRHQGFTWARTLDKAIQQSDYLLLLLDRDGATSEMVTEVVRRAKESTHPPAILPICDNLLNMGFFNPDLRGYLQPIQPQYWNFQADNWDAIQEVVRSIAEGRPWNQSIDADNVPRARSEVGVTESVPPLPTAAPELQHPNGQVELTSQFYIPRPPMETRAMETVAQPGALIRIKAPRQMGKTSLMARLLAHAEQQGCYKVSLSFHLADTQDFADLDRFLRRFLCQDWTPFETAQSVG